MPREHWTLQNQNLQPGQRINNELSFAYWSEYDGIDYPIAVWQGNNHDLGIAGRHSYDQTPFYLLNLSETEQQTGIPIELLLLTTMSGIVQADYHYAPHWDKRTIVDASQFLGLPILAYLASSYHDMLYRNDLTRFTHDHLQLDASNPALAVLVENKNVHFSCLHNLYRDKYIYQTEDFYE